MGKKNRLKIFNQIAAQLPEMQAPIIGTKLYSGEQLINDGTTEVAGKPVNPKGTYQRKESTGTLTVNHARRLHQAYKSLGTEGVKAYVKNIRESAEKQLQAANADNQKLD
jgi:hypothetical protein